MQPEHFDVLIVGAGISGIGAAHHVQEKCPGKTYAVLEARGDVGGTWDLFRYPGIRSDTDMHTLGYPFRPWTGTGVMAEGRSIWQYVRDTAREDGIDEKIRFHHRVVGADWSSEEARWSVEVERSDTGETVRFTSGFLVMCSGYYRYDEGFTPEFEGVESFGGEVIHPQHWPEEADYSGKRIVVIGSGATAVTLVPALAEKAKHVTMLQRSPSYVFSVPGEDPIARTLLRMLPDKLAYRAIRWRNVAMMTVLVQLSRRRPSLIRKLLLRGVERALPAGYDVNTHFNPRYDPWDQRMCFVPDGDLFEAINAGDASVVTEEIAAFSKDGISLKSGEELPADVIVTATGLNLLFLGGAKLSIDGEEIDPSERVAYKGMMLSGVPNMAFTLGYTNASWTLRANLTAVHVCRLLNHMDENGYRSCAPEADPSIRPEPMLDLNSGYILRSLHLIPKQGPKPPWRVQMNYPLDFSAMKLSPVDDGTMKFSRSVASPAPEPRRPTPA